MRLPHRIGEPLVAQIDPVLHQWRRSSRCDGGQCVEVAFADALVAMRDGKSPDGARLHLDRHDWTAFLGAVRAGEFDRAN
jgi:hypothetical protein